VFSEVQVLSIIKIYMEWEAFIVNICNAFLFSTEMQVITQKLKIKRCLTLLCSERDMVKQEE
jgi:hypothetical protein